ncbi:MAG: hypothetical protein ACREX8_16485 [Gammaproteobacteria bacterium]
MIDVPEAQHQRTERGRLQAYGRWTDDGRRCVLLVNHDSTARGLFHRLGAPGLRLSEADTVALCDSILGRAR